MFTPEQNKKLIRNDSFMKVTIKSDKDATDTFIYEI